MTKLGQAPKHDDASAARRLANQRAAGRARDAGLVQRSLTLPAECWERIRAARAPTETLDAQTVARFLQTLESPVGETSPEY